MLERPRVGCRVGRASAHAFGGGDEFIVVWVRVRRLEVDVLGGDCDGAFGTNLAGRYVGGGVAEDVALSMGIC